MIIEYWPLDSRLSPIVTLRIITSCIFISNINSSIVIRSQFRTYYNRSCYQTRIFSASIIWLSYYFISITTESLASCLDLSLSGISLSLTITTEFLSPVILTLSISVQPLYYHPSEKLILCFSLFSNCFSEFFLPLSIFFQIKFFHSLLIF